LGNRLYYVAAAGSSGEELWTSDGTATGTRALTRFAPSSPFSFFSPWLRSAGGRVYFAADDGAHGRELWRSDGTAAGTVRLTNLSAPEPFSADLPASLAVLGSGVVFAASEQGGRPQLWTSRGSPSSTAPLGLDCSGCMLRFPDASLIESAGKAYFVLLRDSQQELWVTDGTSTGSRRATGVCAGSSCSFHALRPWKDRLLFVAANGPEERVWSTDGSPAGTSPFVDLRGNRGAFDSFELAELAGTTYFFATVDHEVGL
jgi:ELWxxDGT repeat protein